jgi:putative acetyltransferase
MQGREFVIRAYRPEDAAATLRIFERAVSITARSRYTEEQVAAWLECPRDLAAWAADRLRAQTFVADAAGTVVGFSDLSDTGYVDRLFVDPDVGRSGVGRALLDHVRETARSQGVPRLTTHASLVARPVFEAKGFHVEHAETVVKGEARLDRFFMAADL